MSRYSNRGSIYLFAPMVEFNVMAEVGDNSTLARRESSCKRILSNKLQLKIFPLFQLRWVSLHELSKNVTGKALLKVSNL
jgi:hypothetical protein